VVNNIAILRIRDGTNTPQPMRSKARSSSDSPTRRIAYLCAGRRDMPYKKNKIHDYDAANNNAPWGIKCWRFFYSFATIC